MLASQGGLVINAWGQERLWVQPGEELKFHFNMTEKQGNNEILEIHLLILMDTMYIQ